MADVILETNKLTKVFKGFTAVSEVSLQVERGHIHALIGPNGAGKTTCFNLLTRFLAPTSGQILFNGRDITNFSAVKRARLGIRRTFQRQQPIGWLTVAENVQAALDWHGGGGGTIADLLALPTRRRLEASRRAMVDEALERCHLTHLADERAGLLPIGQARLLELARAIVDNPTLLLLDEPTSGLEEHEAERFAQLVREFRDRTNAGVILVEHDVPFVMDLSDRVSVLNLGAVIAEGTPDEVSRNPAVRAAYLG